MKLISNKYYLYATGFFSGMSIMAIEMGASRLLTPYFSSSQIVWTVIIGIIMIAMAIGNVWGGRSADKDPNPKKLYTRLLISAVWVAAIPFAGRYVILGVSYVIILGVKSNYLIWASLASCLVLFVYPLMLLGTVTPSLIKYATNNLTENGRTVGSIEACGTVGSILGTFLPTFVTIPNFGTAATFYIFAAILAVLSLLYFISEKKHIVRGAVAAGIITSLIFIPFKYSFAFWDHSLVYEGESIYNYLRVREDAQQVILSTNVLEGVQSVYMKSGGLTGMYYDYALAAPLMAKSENEDISLLVLGMGTGTFAKQCRTYYPGLTAEGVEIDQKIVDLSHKYFELPADIPVSVGDGRAFLRMAGKYDVIMVDAYQDITIPFQMSTSEFFTMVKEHLNKNGVMVVNMNMKTSSPGGINDWIIDTICSVFPETATVNVGNNTNEELFASENADFITEFKNKAASLPDRDPIRTQMNTVAENLNVQHGGDYILTDDKAPVELLGMNALDSLITDTLRGFDGQIQFAN